MNFTDVKSLIASFEAKEPEIVFHWNDLLTDAEGWLVINSLRGGAAGGGTRMRKGLDKREVVSLAKTMEIKFTVSGPQIGGAKSGINFDPNHPDKKEVLKRWYKAIIPLLKAYYGTGGDLNIDELDEVIPFTEEHGLWHPQEGVVTGHYGTKSADKIKKIGQLRAGVSKIVEDQNFKPSQVDQYQIADMITGYGVAESVRLFYSLNNKTLEGKRIIVQGWGNVASGAAFYLAQKGAKIVGIIDKEAGIIQEDGLSFSEVKALFNNKTANKLNADYAESFDRINQKIWDVKADVFLPCAASRLVNKNQIERMIEAGVTLISAGANVPFNDPEIFYGPTTAFADEQISLIPDFIANCGMARVFAYLMSDNKVEVSDRAIFSDVSHTIEHSLRSILLTNPTLKGVTKTAFKISLNKLETVN